MTSGPIPPVAREDVFPEPNLRFGRLPQYSRVGLAAVAFALRDAGMEHWETKRSAGIVASTRAGCLATDIEYYNTVLPEGGGLPSPNLFSSTLPTCFLGEAAIQFGLTGPTLIVNDPAEDALGGVRMALESLSWGECGTMLAGHIDLPARRGDPGDPPPVHRRALHGAGECPGFGRERLRDARPVRWRRRSTRTESGSPT